MVRAVGIEPTRLAPADFKSAEFTNFSMPALTNKLNYIVNLFIPQSVVLHAYTVCESWFVIQLPQHYLSFSEQALFLLRRYPQE